MRRHETPLALIAKRQQKRLDPIPGPWVDGGAYKGEFIEICHRYFPGKKMIAVEPIPRRARKLKKKFAGKTEFLQIHSAALGRENKTINFYVTAGNTFSSTRTATPLLRKIYGHRADVVETLSIPQVRLDRILETPPGLIKLDIQGSEREALLGCTDFLDQVQGLILELCQVERYQGQALAPELQSILEKAGFVCVDKIAHDSRNALNGIVWDALFLKQPVFHSVFHMT